MSHPAALVVDAHGKGRPVLPKPPSEGVFPYFQGNSFSATSISSAKAHGHDRMYSPYGRAYENHYKGEPMLDASAQDHFSQFLDTSDTPPHEMCPDQNQSIDTNFSWLADYIPRTQTDEVPTMSFCGCGTGCNCQGCVEGHLENDFDGVKGCSNPASCMDCTAIPEIRVEFVPDPATMEAVDTWLREISSRAEFPTVPACSSDSYSSIPPFQSQDEIQFESALYALLANSEHSSDQDTASSLASPSGTEFDRRWMYCQGIPHVECAHQDPDGLTTSAVLDEHGVGCTDPSLCAQMSSACSYASVHIVNMISGCSRNGLGVDGEVEFLSDASCQLFERRSGSSRTSSFSSQSSSPFFRSSPSVASDLEVPCGTGDVHSSVSSCRSGLRTTINN